MSPETYFRHSNKICKNEPGIQDIGRWEHLILWGFYGPLVCRRQKRPMERAAWPIWMLTRREVFWLHQCQATDSWMPCCIQRTKTESQELEQHPPKRDNTRTITTTQKLSIIVIIHVIFNKSTEAIKYVHMHVNYHSYSALQEGAMYVSEQIIYIAV